ncbi:MAG TPA: hypothetical protein VMT75_08775 [Candidatus Saccharimonadales bacterium]|nr:hypothetical protein [Candidatus Saccharimonadales bacterium]
MATQEKHDTHHKALSINLDGTIFGSFAEIGAGQEVARWFLRVGGASGTVAKTISAYDKEVSDDLYGSGTRYVSKPRLEAMLDNEWAQLLVQLQPTRGTTARFFAFVDTISARNFAGTNDCHGWMGLRFLQQPSGEASQIILHANLRDSTNLRQQEAVGILGVNLIYATHHALGSPAEFLASLFEDLTLSRLEIDCVSLSGPAFAGWDARLLHAQLVAGGYAEAVAFLENNQYVPANELLYKRAIVLAPGRFDSVAQLHVDLIQATLADLPEPEVKDSKGALGLFCLTTAPGNGQENNVTAQEIVEHVVELQKLGYGVMVFRARELYTMSAFVNRYTKARIHFAISLTVLVKVLEDNYANLAGSLLEGIARLFAQNVRLSVYPMPAEDVERRVKSAGLTGWHWKVTDGMVYANELYPDEPVGHLYQYLLSSEFILIGKPKGNQAAAG